MALVVHTWVSCRFIYILYSSPYLHFVILLEIILITATPSSTRTRTASTLLTLLTGTMPRLPRETRRVLSIRRPRRLIYCPLRLPVMYYRNFMTYFSRFHNNVSDSNVVNVTSRKGDVPPRGTTWGKLTIIIKSLDSDISVDLHKNAKSHTAAQVMSLDDLMTRLWAPE